jgi:glycosyltransferase involved in cell wall biosynthesis
MIVTHLVASPFLGGPERQVLGLAAGLPRSYRTVFLSFSEGGRCRPFLNEARRTGFEAVELERNSRNPRAAVREVADYLRRLGADVLCCHGYKPDVLGWMAARRAGVPAVAVSRGWTAATLKVRLNETLDRFCLRRMDRVVCVSEGQAVKVRRAGVPPGCVVVIRNAIRAERFDRPEPAGRDRLQALFKPPLARIVGAAGRLSPEKGFGVLVEAVGRLVSEVPDVGFVIFGDGPLRAQLSRRIDSEGLTGRCLLAGFCDDLDRLLPHLDLLVLPSFTEGLPNVVLEAFAAGVPVVATAVGGTPEVVVDGVNGYLVPAGDPAALARRIRDALEVEERRRAMGQRGRDRIRNEFTFEAQSARYQQLFDELAGSRR